MADMTAQMLGFQNPNAAPWWANGGFGGALGAWYTDPVTGQTYQPITDVGNNNAEGGGGIMPTRTGYAAYDMSAPGGQRAEDGQTYDEYGDDGKFTANRNFLSTKDDLGELLGYFALAAGGMNFLPGGMFGGPAGGAAAGAGEAAGAGFSGAAAGDAGLMYAGADAAAAGSLGSAAIPTAGMGTGAMGAGAAGLGAAGGGGGGGLSGLFGGGGAAGGTGALGALGSALGGGGSSLLGLGSTVLGALSGGQGQDASTSSTRAMDSRMDQLFYGDLAPRTQGVLGSQMGQAQTAGNQLMGVGGGLLGRTAPGTAENPYLKSIADDMQRRTQEMLGQNNLAIQGNAVGVGGLGGSRQGVAQGIAAGRAADSLQGQVANLYGGAYETDQNRLRQDWTLGSTFLNQGLNTPFQPLKNTSDIYSPFTGFGTTTNNAQSGGGWQGGVGGALAGMSFGKQMGWF